MSTGRAQAAEAGQDAPRGRIATERPEAPPGSGGPGGPGRRWRTRDTVRRAATGTRAWLRSPSGRRTQGHLLLIAAFTAAGVGVTWPMTPRLVDGRLLANSDVASYVWALWWVAHQVSHLGDPWFTQYMAAPVGIELGFDTLMPLPGLIMTPVTLLSGPATSFAVLTIAVPGLMCYAAYRAARLWLGQPGSIAAGALFGLSTMAVWQNLYHLNISIGTVFLPLTLEAAVRLRRSPGRRQGIALGVVLGASVLTNQESAVLATLLAAAALLPWLIRLASEARGARRARGAHQPAQPAARPQLRSLGLGAIVAAVIASPQLIAMILQVVHGGTRIPQASSAQLTQSYRNYGVGLPTLFAPSPRLGHFHLGQLASAYQFTDPAQHLEGIPTFGVILAGLGVAGLVLCWRQRPMRWLGLMWLAGAALALGPTLIIGTTTFIPLATRWHNVTVSELMPYTWLIRIPGMSALREADRLALLGLLGAAILAGAAVGWIWQHARPVLAGVALVALAGGAYLEAGWQAKAPTMPATMPSVDAPIAFDHSHSIVVDVNFGLRGGVNVTGFRMPPQALILATADGHPRANSYTSWVPQPTVDGINRIPFLRFLYDAQNGKRFPGPDRIAARRSARDQDIRWIVVWHKAHHSARTAVIRYLYNTGFKIAYQVHDGFHGITVWKRRS
jgi:hypothetical protein